MPVVADVREDDYCLDPDAAAAAISPRTRFLLPVHLYGQMADLRALTRVASRPRLSGSSRTPARRTAPSATGAPRAAVGMRGGLQLLPGQEPRRDRRRGRARDRRRRARRDGALAARARPGAGSTTTRSRATRPASTRSRRSPCCTSFRTSTAGPPSDVRSRRATRPSSPASATCVCRPSRPAASPSGTSTSCAPPIRPRSRTSSRTRGDRQRPPLPGAAAPLGGVRAARLPAGRVPGRGGALARGALPAALPRHDGGAARRGRACREDVLRGLLTVADSAGKRGAVPAPRTTSSSAWASSCTRSRTSTAAGSGTRARIGPFVEIQSGVEIGARCKIQSHSFICTGVTIADEVFVGHGVLFINDKRPRATTDDGELQTADDWTLLPTLVERGASLGSGCVVLGGDPHRRGGARRRRRRRHPRRRRRRGRRRDSRARRGRREGAMRKLKHLLNRLP